jgi:hypothetical protein
MMPTYNEKFLFSIHPRLEKRMKVGLNRYDFPGLCGRIIDICCLFYKGKIFGGDRLSSVLCIKLFFKT